MSQNSSAPKSITGTNGNDVLTGGAGADTINGGAGNDTITGGAGDDLLNGGDGNDVIRGGAGNDRIYGGAGNDDLSGGNGTDTIDGGDGNDTIAGGGGDDQLLGGAGNDVITGGNGADTIDGGDGNDTIAGGGGNDQVTGGAGNDLITGGNGADTIDGGAGNDTITGGGGNDQINGGDGNDVIAGGSGSDTIDGGAGNDVITGGSGSELIKGGAGNDTIDAGGGNDVIIGGTGNDVIDGGGGFDTAVFSGSVLNYAVTRGKNASATTTVSGADGIDTLKQVEALQFDDYTLYLDGRNNAPLVLGETATVGEDGSLSFRSADLLANDRDFDGQTLSLTSVNGAGMTGSVALGADGKIVYTPGSALQSLAAGQSVVETFTYTVSDGVGGTAVGTVSVTVTGSNDAPVAVADTARTNGNAVLTIDVLANDTDVDTGAVLSIAGIGPGNAATATTAHGGTVSVVNGKLVYDGSGSAEVKALAAGQSLVETISYTVSDGLGGTSVGTVSVNVAGVNDAPVAVADTAQTGANAAVTINVLANDTDVDNGAVLSIAGIGPGNAATATTAHGGTVSVVNGKLVYDGSGSAEVKALAAGQSLVETISYTVSDGLGGTSVGTASVTVTGVNDAPVAVADSAQTGAAAAVTIDVLANDTDPDDGAVLSIAGIGPGNAATVTTAHGGTVSVVDGKLVYDASGSAEVKALAAGESLVETISYTVSDGAGGTSASTVSVTVTGANDAPVGLADAAQTSATAAVTIDVLANDTDPDNGAVLSIAGIGPGNAATATTVHGGTVSVVDGKLVYDARGSAEVKALAAGQNLVETISYTVSDGLGGTSVGTASVTVTGVNDAPVAVADSAQIGAAAAVTIDVLANDTDPDNGAVLSIAGIGPDNAATATTVHGGTVSVVDGKLVYDASGSAEVKALAAGESLVETISYTVSDGLGGTSVSTVSVTVTGVNDAPVGLADAAQTSANAAVTVDVLANDTDPDNGAVLSIAGIGPDNAATAITAHGATVSVVDGKLVYDASGSAEVKALAAGESLVETIFYTVSDGLGGTSVSTVSVTVTGVNDAPVGLADAAQASGNAAATIDVLANDTDPDNGAVLAIAGLGPDNATSIVTDHGGVASIVDGKLVYDASGSVEAKALAAGQSLVETISYTVSDGLGGISVSAVSITVNGVNDAPVGGADLAQTDEDTAITLNVLANDSDPDNGAVLSIAGLGTVGSTTGTTALGGAVTIVNGKVVYDPSGSAALGALNQGQSATDSFSYFVTDQSGALSQVTASVTVSGLADNIVLTGGPGNDTLVGGSFGDSLSGGAGNDSLDGGPGADTLVGGLGNDTFVVDNVGDVVIELAGEGTDGVQTGLTPYTLPANVENLIYTGSGNASLTGNTLANSLTGGAGNDTLDGGAGTDTLDGGLGADMMIGGAGNDTYVVDDIGDVVVELPLSSQGTADTVRTSLASYTLGANVENLTYTGSGNATLTGNTLANIITGGAGADTMIGGAGNDTYVVDNIGDVVIDSPNEGSDTVRTALTSYILGANVNLENLTYIGTGNAVLTGNAAANNISGGAGNDTIDGGLGADTMSGGLGDDLYLVDNAGDLIGENLNGGTDEVRTTLSSYTLTANVENLTYMGTGNAVLTGNTSDNVLTGGAGSDTMTGSTGNDTYLVNNVGDVVVELAGEGTDTVRTSLASYTLGANVENLTYTGSGNATLTGNALSNVITGGTGADTMTGGVGDDVYVVDNAGDVVVELAGEGNDTVSTSLTSYTLGATVENLTYTGSGNATLTGNALDNYITGGTGADTMTGGGGNDVYMVDNAGDVVIAGAGTDTVVTTLASYTMGANVDQLVHTGGGTAILTGNALNNLINGGAGAQTMVGGAASDTYTVDDIGDVIVEAAGSAAGTADEVYLYLSSYTMPDNVEVLSFQSSGNTNVIGNALANTIFGGSGNDTLSGGLGNDVLIGGAGADVFRMSTTEGFDTISDFQTGSDKVEVVIPTGFGNLAAGALDPSHFALNAPTGANTWFVFNTTTHRLSFDADGSGAGAAVNLATLTGVSALAASDIQIALS